MSVLKRKKTNEYASKVIDHFKKIHFKCEESKNMLVYKK